MSPAEHCPRCMRPASMTGHGETGAETVTRWLCGCGNRWETRYLTAAYIRDECDEAD